MNHSSHGGPYHVRPYCQEDREACLALFESNVPKYFAPEELKDFVSDLDDLKWPYLVMEDENGKIVASGGYGAIGEDGTVAALCWGMVRRDLHRCGLGRRLLVERLKRIAAEPKFTRVTIETSQYSRGFFERFGFVAKRVCPDGFAPGLDLVEMELDLSRLKL